MRIFNWIFSRKFHLIAVWKSEIWTPLRFRAAWITAMVTRIKIPHLPEYSPSERLICPCPFRWEVLPPLISFSNARVLFCDDQVPLIKCDSVSKIRHKSDTRGTHFYVDERHQEFELLVTEITRDILIAFSPWIMTFLLTSISLYFARWVIKLIPTIRRFFRW